MYVYVYVHVSLFVLISLLHFISIMSIKELIHFILNLILDLVLVPGSSTSANRSATANASLLSSTSILSGFSSAAASIEVSHIMFIVVITVDIIILIELDTDPLMTFIINTLIAVIIC